MLNYFRKKFQDKRTKILNLKKNNFFNSNKFNYLNLEYKNFGDKNPNKFFFVIRRTPGAGFFSNLNFVIHNLYICEKLKMIPVIDMENYHTLYNCKIKIDNSKNAWNYYFQNVSNYSLNDVYTSKNDIMYDNRTSEKDFTKNLKNSKFKYFNGFQY